MLREFLSRLRFLLRGKSREEVDEEIQFHLEQQVNANIEASGIFPSTFNKRMTQPPVECQGGGEFYFFEIVKGWMSPSGLLFPIPLGRLHPANAAHVEPLANRLSLPLI